jgi:hypothetical protein
MTNDIPDTLLDHAALAGRTVHVRRGPRWETYVVRPEGGLSPTRGVIPEVHGWRSPRGN